MNKRYFYVLCAITATLLLGATVSYTQDGPPGGRRGGPRDMMRMFPVMTALDADGDGVISAAEINNASAALRKLDKNGDGQLTEDEMRPNFPQGGPGGRGGQSGPSADEIVNQLLEFDKNGDGQLAKAEVPERMHGLFERGDTNKDGILSKDELRKLAEAQSNAMRPNERDEHDEHREGERRPQRPPIQ